MPWEAVLKAGLGKRKGAQSNAMGYQPPSPPGIAPLLQKRFLDEAGHFGIAGVRNAEICRNQRITRNQTTIPSPIFTTARGEAFVFSHMPQVYPTQHVALDGSRFFGETLPENRFAPKIQVRCIN